MFSIIISWTCHRQCFSEMLVVLRKKKNKLYGSHRDRFQRHTHQLLNIVFDLGSQRRIVCTYMVFYLRLTNRKLSLSLEQNTVSEYHRYMYFNGIIRLFFFRNTSYLEWSLPIMRACCLFRIGR